MNIKEIMSHDRFANLTGIELLEVGEGTSKAKLKIEEHHLNALNIVQGGAIFTLADLAFAAASNSYGTIAVGINVSISFLKAEGTGTLYAEAFENARNNKIASYTINITNDLGELIACCQGMVYRKKDRHAEA